MFMLSHPCVSWPTSCFGRVHHPAVIPVRRWRSAFGLGEDSLHTLLWTACSSWASVHCWCTAAVPEPPSPLPWGVPVLSASPLELMFSVPMSSSCLFLLITVWWRHSPVAFGDRMLGGKILETKCMIETVIDSLYSFSFHFLSSFPSHLFPVCLLPAAL